jgi:hypothetical protein
MVLEIADSSSEWEQTACQFALVASSVRLNEARPAVKRGAL